MKPTIPQLRGEWLVLAAAVLWGTTGTAQALAPADAAPVTVGSMRLALGGIALLAIAVLRGTLRAGRPWPIRTLIAAAVCIAGYQVCFFSGVAATGVAAGTLVGIGSAPVVAGALDWLVEGVRPGRRWAGATGLAILGCTLLAFSSSGAVFHAWGILLAVSAGACYAVFTLFSKKLLEGRPPDAVMAVVFCLGAAMLAPILMLVDLSWLGQPGGLAVALHLGLAATALAYVFFGRGLKSISASTAVTLTLAEPLTAGLLGVFVLGEQLAPVGWAGVILLASGLALISLNPGK